MMSELIHIKEGVEYTIVRGFPYACVEIKECY